MWECVQACNGNLFIAHAKDLEPLTGIQTQVV